MWQVNQARMLALSINFCCLCGSELLHEAAHCLPFSKLPMGESYREAFA